MTKQTIFFRTFFLVLFLTLAGTSGFSQQIADSSDIVMSPSQLASFIKRIATLKQQQIDRQQKEQLLTEVEWAVIKRLAEQPYPEAESPKTFGYPNTRTSQTTDLTDNTVSEQVKDINRRLDILMQMIFASRQPVVGWDGRYPATGYRQPDGRIQKVDTVFINPDGSLYRPQQTVIAPSSRQSNGKQIMVKEDKPQAPATPVRVDTIYIGDGKASLHESARNKQQNLKTTGEIPDKTSQAQFQSIEDVQDYPGTDSLRKIPDTVYVYQDESGYRTFVSQGFNTDKARLQESRSMPADRKTQKNQREEKENLRVIQTPPQVIYLNQDKQKNPQPVIIYRDQRESGTQRKNQIQEADSIRNAEVLQQQIMGNKISNLESQIGLLTQLLSGAEHNDKQKYNDDINRLKIQVSALTTELEISKQKLSEQVEKTEPKPSQDIRNDSIPKPGAADNLFKIYFANNSTTISADDHATLSKIAEAMKVDPDLIVLLRGFASNVGNASYNERIANQRASAVQKWLLSRGVSYSNLFTQGRGIDDTSSADQARRVEITLLRK